MPLQTTRGVRAVRCSTVHSRCWSLSSSFSAHSVPLQPTSYPCETPDFTQHPKTSTAAVVLSRRAHDVSPLCRVTQGTGCTATRLGR